MYPKKRGELAREGDRGLNADNLPSILSWLAIVGRQLVDCV